MLSKFISNSRLLFQNPELFFEKALRLVKSNVRSLDKNVKRFVNHNRDVWGDWRNPNPKSEILLDPFSVPEWNIVTSYFVNVLAEKNESKILTFSRDRLSGSNRLRKSYNVAGHVGVHLNARKQKKERDQLTQAFRDQVETKRDVYEYSVNGYWIGIDIYETYLRGGKPTIDFEDPEFWKVVKEGMEILIFWRDYFHAHRVAGVIISHDCYNILNILAKVAYRSRVKVYLPNARGMQLSFEPHSIYSTRFWNYPKGFRQLPQREQQQAIQWSKNRLNQRLNGKVGVDMKYSTKSAFTGNNSDATPVLRNSHRLKVLIATHCFYDNPHGLGGMLFLDFYEWLSFLCEMSNKTDYDWYLKTHPDYLPGTLETINSIISKSPKIRLIPPETSFHQLAKEGLSWALTCYGSIGHELPLLGINVLNAAYNPHIAYDFNWHAKSIEEYERLLLNLPSLKKEIDPDQIYEYYYMNYHYTYVDDLVYTSHRQMIADLKPEEQMGPQAYKYYLDQFTDSKHREIISKMVAFIDSGKPNYFVNGPE